MLGAYVGTATMVATGNFWLALVAASAGIALLGAVISGDDAAATDWARPADDDPGDLRHLARPPKLGTYKVWPGGAQDPSPSPATSALFHPSTPGTGSSSRCCRRRSSARSGLHEVRQVWNLDPRHDPGSRQWQAMGIPVPLVHTMVFAIGAAMAAASGVLFGPLVGVNHAMGLDLILKAFIVVVVGGMGNLGGSILASIFISMLEAFASIWWSPAQAVIVSFAVLILTLPLQAHGPVCSDALAIRHRLKAGVFPSQAETGMATRPSPSATGSASASSRRLAVAPLVLPEFWRRFRRRSWIGDYWRCRSTS